MGEKAGGFPSRLTLDLASRRDCVVVSRALAAGAVSGLQTI